MLGGDASKHMLEIVQERSCASLESNAHGDSFLTPFYGRITTGKSPSDKAVLVDNVSGARTTTNIPHELITVQGRKQMTSPPMSATPVSRRALMSPKGGLTSQVLLYKVDSHTLNSKVLKANTFTTPLS